jgi:SAM-dependent methyltransferase
MSVPAGLDGLLAPGRTLRPASGAVLSALAPGAIAPYDRHASTYDKLIGSPLYNRLVWGTRVGDYAAFAAEALRAGDGPLLDAGAGTAVFTAGVYRGAPRPLVLADLSAAMLERAAARLGAGTAAFVQADLLDLPFAPGSFDAVACHGVLHVLDDPWAVLPALRDQAAPGAPVFVSMLVADRRVGGAYLRVLRRVGEAGPARTAADFERAAREVFGPSATVEHKGSMAYLRAER